MAETINYQLFLTDDNTMKFRDWREKINGMNDSNMVKIDTALSQKALKSTSIDVVLSASAWVGSQAPFIQEISIDGLTEDHNGTASIASSATMEQRLIAREAAMSVTGQRDGVLVISADEFVPSVDIPITVVLIG